MHINIRVFLGHSHFKSADAFRHLVFILCARPFVCMLYLSRSVFRLVLSLSFFRSFALSLFFLSLNHIWSILLSGTILFRSVMFFFSERMMCEIHTVNSIIEMFKWIAKYLFGRAKKKFACISSKMDTLELSQLVYSYLAVWYGSSMQ